MLLYICFLGVPSADSVIASHRLACNDFGRSMSLRTTDVMVLGSLNLPSITISGT